MLNVWKIKFNKVKTKRWCSLLKMPKKSNWGKGWATTPNAALFWAKTLTFNEFQEFLANGGNYKTATQNWIKKEQLKLKLNQIKL